MALILKNLSYNNLIREITISYKPGSLYGIIGPNGAGKSSLLKTVTGIWQPTSGLVEWNGKDLLKQPREEISKTISLVPQNPQLQFDITAYEMAALGRYPHHEKHLHSLAVERGLKHADAWHLKDAFLSELSGGEKQRIYIARALTTEAPVILLDEPMTHLDLRHQLDIWKLLRQMAEQGKTVIAAIHDLAAASRHCDELQVIHQGRSLTYGPGPAVLTDKLLKEVFGLLRNEISF